MDSAGDDDQAPSDRRILRAAASDRVMPSSSSKVIELHPEDRALVSRMRRGDDRAFDEYFERYFQSVYRFALSRLGGDTELAKEIAQATICTGIEKLDGYRGEASLFTWLCAICRHEITGHFRKLGRRPIEVELPEEGTIGRAALESLVAVREDPEQVALRNEIGRLVHVTVDHLPPHYQNALTWKYVEGLSVDEIAARLELSTKAAESVLTRARASFRDAYASLVAPALPTPVSGDRR